MQDSRFITNYMESRIFEQHIRTINKIESAQEFKQFLQTNAETLMKREQTYHQEANLCRVQGNCPTLSSLLKK
jgi:hypothetical protein